MLSDVHSFADCGLIGRYRVVPIAVASVYGPTRAADLTFITVRAGARLVLQTGFFGGLDAEQGTDAILVPQRVVPEDAVARRFVRSGIIETTEASRLREALVEIGSIESGVLVSTGSIAAETDRLVGRWSQAGLAGVDLESAATVAVARAFGARTGVALHIIDNLVRGEHFQHPEVAGEHLRARRIARVDRLLHLALDYAVREIADIVEGPGQGPADRRPATEVAGSATSDPATSGSPTD